MKPHPTITNRYADADEQRAYLDRLFDDGAKHYDRIDGLGSFGTGPKYRRDAQKRAGLRPGMTLIDVAAGTGLMAEGAIRLGVAPADIVCVDPSGGMLAETRRKLGVETVQGVATDIPLSSARFDFLTMGFALRHVSDLESAFREYLRVLKPGGRMLLLEITKPQSRIGSLWFRFWFRDFYPLFTRVVTGSRQASEMMVYYWETMDAVVPAETIVAAMKNAGLVDVRRHVVGGIFSEYTAQRRAE
jgi:demethylmenaquinone methyltransferase/2-methoxy-6-polyprenyl-1,4-benzoquinol methylase